jgi:hypothetical protein
VEARQNGSFALDPPGALNMESVFGKDSLLIANNLAKVEAPHISRVMSYGKLQAH